MLVTFVCEANQARSPYAAELWRTELAVRGLDWDVASAGVRAQPGRPVLPGLLTAAPTYADALRSHVSRPVDERLVAGSDLILAMTREQADRIGIRFEHLADRLFVLGELADLLELAAASAEQAGPVVPAVGTLDDVRAAAHVRLAAAREHRILRGLRDDDVADPADPRNPMRDAVHVIGHHVRRIATGLLD